MGSAMTMYRVVEGMLLASDCASVESGYIRFDTRRTCLLIVTPNKVQVVRADGQASWGASFISVPITSLVLMQDIGDQGLLDTIKATLAGLILPDAPVDNRLVN